MCLCRYFSSRKPILSKNIHKHKLEDENLVLILDGNLYFKVLEVINGLYKGFTQKHMLIFLAWIQNIPLF